MDSFGETAVTSSPRLVAPVLSFGRMYNSSSFTIRKQHENKRVLISLFQKKKVTAFLCYCLVFCLCHKLFCVYLSHHFLGFGFFRKQWNLVVAVVPVTMKELEARAFRRPVTGLPVVADASSSCVESRGCTSSSVRQYLQSMH